MQAREPDVSVSVESEGEETTRTDPDNLTGQSRDGRSATPEHAVESFGGTVRLVRARQLHRACCTRTMVKFFVVTFVLVTILCVSLALIAHYGLDSELGRFFQTTFSFALGVLIPNPKLPKSDGDRPPTQQH